MKIVSKYGSLLWIGSPYRSPSTDVTNNLELQILSPSICDGIYQNVAGHSQRQLTLLVPCGITSFIYRVSHKIAIIRLTQNPSFLNTFT